LRCLPGLQLVDEFALQADRLQRSTARSKSSRPHFLHEGLLIEEHGGFEEAFPAVLVGEKLEHQAARAVERLAHRPRQLGKPRSATWIVP